VKSVAENGQVKLTINGRDIVSAPGRLLIDIAEEQDIFVPRFCYHPGLESVAACRMCLVEIEGSKRPLEPACTTRVTDGMVVRTDSKGALDAQESVLELLLINHPLDCPICDRGGECPLQDQALRFGPGSSRYQEPKRHFPKPIPISKLVMLDRERCVLCWRCVRFSEEVAGDPFIDLMDRGSLTQINIAEEEPFDSYFSGNTIQICPVGALTATSYRFLSRPWDLDVAQTVCSFCSVGCAISLEHRSGQVLRSQALPNENVNSFWSCDKGRFGHRYISHAERLRVPLIRGPSPSGSDEFVEVSWQEAQETVAVRLRSILAEDGPAAIGFMGGSHATNEDLYAAGRFFREIVGTQNLDFRTFDAGFPYEWLTRDGIAGSSALLDDLDRAKAILWIGPDPKEELPVLFLRLRRASMKGTKLVVAHPRRISLSSLGLHLAFRPGAEAEVVRSLRGTPSDSGVAEDQVRTAREALAEGPVVVCIGQQFVGRSMRRALSEIVSLIDELPDAKVLLCVPNANSQGALDMGVSPYLSARHQRIPDGLDSAGMLAAAAEGRLKLLWLCGADLASDFPDAALVGAALSSDVFLVVSELFPTDTARSADVLLPAMAFAEKEGSFTNLERRIQKVNPAVAAPGVARADWQIFSEMASRLGGGWGWSSTQDVAAEIAARVPTHSGYSWERIEQAPLPTPRAGTKPGEGAWPLSWELRAVDATRRKGYVWEPPGPASGSLDRLPSGREKQMRPSGTGARPLAGPADTGPERVGPTPDYPLMLLVGRALYDEGQMVSRSPELRNLTPQPFVELHPDEARVRGLSAGEMVTVFSPKGSTTVALRVSKDTPAGAAYMLFDQPGVRANVLLDSGRSATFVEVSR